jgi:hypothetical protein
MRRLRITVGVACWIAASGLLCWWLTGRGPQSALQPAVSAALCRYAIGHRREAELQFVEDCSAWIGDPIFVVEPGPAVRQVGEIVAVTATPTGMTGRGVFYSSAPPVDAAAKLTYYETPDSIQWVLQTMLSEAKRGQIVAELHAALDQNREELLRLLKPIAEDSLRDLLLVVEEDLPPALERRRPQLERLSDKYQREVIERELLPFLRAEVWPIVRKHTEPLVQDIGRELWQRASLWRFGWRYLYDQSPLPEKNLARQEWQRFVERDVEPVLQQHAEDFLRVEQQIVREVARNPQVHEKVRTTLTQLAEDVEVKHVVEDLATEVVLQNPRLKAVLEKHWRGPRAQQALRLSAERLEPTVVRIGELLLGSPQQGISPEFAHVLRNQILQKDRHWLVLDASACTASRATAGQLTLRVPRGTATGLNPFMPAP